MLFAYWVEVKVICEITSANFSDGVDVRRRDVSIAALSDVRGVWGEALGVGP